MNSHGSPWTASAVVPVFNGAETLGRCLGCLTRQGEDLKEIIVVDDGSADGSQPIAEAFARRDARVVVVKHGDNQGLARTLNDGIGRASGEAVLIVQQDCELLNEDWVSRGLGLLRENQPCCVSANPTYPFREMTPVDIAFGLLRDHFAPMEGEKEQLGFSEFKCDLIPRAALGDAPFDTRFRISGEDQVLSEKLWGAGYPILRFRSLAYVQRSGGTASLGSQLRKEVVYGKSEGGVLLRTRLRAVSRSARSIPSQRRLVNRLTGLAFVVGLASLVLLLGLRAGLTLLAIPLVVIGLRMVVLGLRGRPLLSHGLIAPRSLGLALGVAPLADTAYVGALFSGIFTFLLTHRV